MPFWANQILKSWSTSMQVGSKRLDYFEINKGIKLCTKQAIIIKNVHLLQFKFTKFNVGQQFNAWWSKGNF